MRASTQEPLLGFGAVEIFFRIELCACCPAKWADLDENVAHFRGEFEGIAVGDDNVGILPLSSVPT